MGLREAIAENAHEVWAAARIKEGWTYGKGRDDANKKYPDLTHIHHCWIVKRNMSA